MNTGIQRSSSRKRHGTWRPQNDLPQVACSSAVAFSTRQQSGHSTDSTLIVAAEAEDESAGAGSEATAAHQSVR